MIVLFIIVFALLRNVDSEKEAEKESEKASPTCKSHWNLCRDNDDVANNFVGDDNTGGWAVARYRCLEAAKISAKYGDPQFPPVSFNSYNMGEDYPKTGIFILFETDARFQNIYGAMTHVNVKCTYDIKRVRVVDMKYSLN